MNIQFKRDRRYLTLKDFNIHINIPKGYSDKIDQGNLIYNKEIISLK